MKKKILFLSNVPSPYSVEYLNELGKLADVTAVYERATSSERDRSWEKLNIKNFSCNILEGVKASADSAFSPQVVKYIKNHRKDVIIIANPLTPTGIFAIMYCKMHHIDFVLQSEGGLAGRGKGPKEAFKRFVMRGATLYLSGMNPKRDYFLTYGATEDLIVQYPFASMYQKDIRENPPSEEEKRKAKEELGVKEPVMVLFAGRFIPGKGVDALIKACAGISDIGLYLVGGEPTEEYKRLSEECGVEIHCAPHCKFEQLQKYYIASDIFVLPTHSDTWGLVINEAMSFGQPIITTNRCVAGLELVTDGENGYLIHVNDVDTLHEHIKFLVDNPQKRNSMGKKSLEKIQRYSYENMAETIYSALENWRKG